MNDAANEDQQNGKSVTEKTVTMEVGCNETEGSKPEQSMANIRVVKLLRKASNKDTGTGEKPYMCGFCGEHF